jgi:hypothetical protein
MAVALPNLGQQILFATCNLLMHICGHDKIIGIQAWKLPDA